MKRKLFILPALLLAGMAFAQEVDLEAIEKIKKEGLENSKVEEIAFQLVDKAGPRLSNSEGYERATEYAIKQLSEWGLENAAAEPWGEFGRGWEMEKSYIAMTKPYYMPFIAIPKAWTESTKGEVSGKVVFLDIKTEEDFAKYEGKLKGAIVAIKPTGTQEPTFEQDAVRYTVEQLHGMEHPAPRGGGNSSYTPEMLEQFRAARALGQKVNEFMAEEGVALIIKGVNGRHGTLFTSSPRGYLKDTPEGIPELETAPENVNLMARLSENGVEVEVEAEVETRYRNEDLQGYNVIAEIPGSDPTLKSEVVMLGGHLDSWHGATGATDNAAGCIVMMEAVRILKATGLQPKRTVRIALWGGEEQGLHGSRGYVKNHFGDRETMELKPEHEKISAYYNIDNGTGKVRGIYLQGNAAVQPIFNEWFAPLDDIVEDRTITISNTGGTDHQSFDALSIPGFQFIQDPIEYRTRTHHTNMDTFERLELDDLKQMAVVIASFVYNTAQREEMLPRKELRKVE
ncbi:M20/M25/M40 family metallo-hydrolase [Algoriphagus sp. D3-2-R+10]|uniref:M20/M25/M40 family metallo-hydrolase n=1 Tax=Algoriphagus aurantiacus TaxID=3103948 RepID=UPI002B38FB6F|nr:M20/M25/M40 family metallo-hydrolase [Algoriphagus sp. D3-2-R+10]MEB2776953.1 M20/M25/M40 family metallo-hydrolase [Algoriphagus sp. D3-2-R+10]